MKNVLSASMLAVALAICWSRASIGGRKRTPQLGKIESSPNESGFAFRILERAKPTDKEPASVVQTWTYPNASGDYKGRSGSPPLHIHLYDDEDFEILEGTMGYVLEGREGILNTGDTATLPARKPHTFWNVNPDKVLRLKITTINRSGQYSPSERFFEQWASNAYDHGGIENVSPLQLIVMLDWGGIVPAAPYPVRMFVHHVIVPLGKLLGYKGCYPEYMLP